MLMTVPVCATVPEMPLPTGSRISLLAPWATLLHSSLRSRSRMKIEQRSAETTFAAWLRMRGSRLSRSRSAAICLATSRMDWSFFTRPARSCGLMAAEGGGGGLTPLLLARLAVGLLAALALGCGLRLFLQVEPRQLGPAAWAYLGGGSNSLVLVHGT